MRDNAWLNKKLENILRDYFPEVEIKNQIIIKFGQKARTRLGSIRKAKNGSDTAITITGYFQNEQAPEYLINLTIAHELCHYAHGFFSPLPKLSRYPHQGGIVDKELIDRGLGRELANQKTWLKSNWKNIVGSHKIIRRRKRRISLFRIFSI